MNTLLVLSLTGSCLLLFYFIYGKLQKGMGEWRRRWLFLVSLLYLIPLRWLRSQYIAGLRNTGGVLFKSSKFDFSFYRDYVELTTKSGDLYHSAALRLNVCFGIVWLTVTLGLFFTMVGKYLLIRHKLTIYCQEEEESTGQDILDKLCREMGICRKVRLLKCQGMPPFSMGIFHPMIVLPGGLDGKSREMILRHELAHIKNYDALLSMLVSLTAIVHWFNPALPLLKREWRRISELYCDKIALTGLTSGEQELYIKLLLKESHKAESKVTKVQIRQFISKRSAEENISERVEYIMGKKTWNGTFKAYISGMALVVALLTSSLTVFAYKETYQISGVSDVEAKEASNFFQKKADVQLVSASSILAPEIIIYDQQIVDKDGNIYPLNSDASIDVACKHTYEEYIYMRHMRNSEGGCTVEYYDAERCSKCGNVVVGEQTQVVTYKICPHN